MLRQKSIKIEQIALDYINELAEKDNRSFNYIVNKTFVDLANKKKPSTGVAKVKASSKPELFNQVLRYIEECTGRKFKESTDLLARIGEGYTFEQFSKMINYKASEWMGTDMQKYLRPSTLFNKTKFEGYLSDAEQGVQTHEEYQRNNISDKERDRAEVRRQLSDPNYALANF